MNILWFQSGGCSGCTLSFLGLEEMDLIEWSRSMQLNWLWHPSLTEHSGSETQAMLDAVLKDEIKLDIFALKGRLSWDQTAADAFICLPEPKHLPRS